MRRITISVPDEAHRALKLLSILEGKAFGRVVLEAIDYYLKHKDAYNLSVSMKKENQQDSSKQ
jgi:predicted DNA-binding protein